MSRGERSSKPRALAPSAAERLGAIVEAAEQAAESVIDDAEKQAHRYLEEAEAEADRLVAERLDEQSRLVESLISQAEELREQAERMVVSLERARVELGAEQGGRPSADSSRRSHLSAVEEDPEREESRGSSAGARLLATQMAVSGSSREEIEIRLRNGFDIEDPTGILDAILGPED